MDDGSTVFTKDGKLVVKVSSACPDGMCLNSGSAPRKHIVSRNVTYITPESDGKREVLEEPAKFFLEEIRYVC